MTARGARWEARQKGETTYVGSPCKHGHDGLRFTSGGGCRDCTVAMLEKRRRAAGMMPKGVAGLCESIAKRKASAAAYRKRHPELHAKRNRSWARKNREIVRERMRERYGEDPAVFIQRARENRVRRMGAAGSYSAEDAKGVRAGQNWRCIACGTGGLLTMDHIVPLVRGGSNWPKNLQAMRKPCNVSKGARTMCEWIASGCAPARLLVFIPE